MQSRSCQEDDDINQETGCVISLDNSWCITVDHRLHNRCCACAYQLLCKRTTAVVRPKILTISTTYPISFNNFNNKKRVNHKLMTHPLLCLYIAFYLKPQSFLRASASSFSTSFSISSGRLQKKSMPVLSSSVLMFTTYLPSLSPFSNALFS